MRYFMCFCSLLLMVSCGNLETASNTNTSNADFFNGAEGKGFLNLNFLEG